MLEAADSWLHASQQLPSMPFAGSCTDSFSMSHTWPMAANTADEACAAASLAPEAVAF